jgi:hypothetical protein
MHEDERALRLGGSGLSPLTRSPPRRPSRPAASIGRLAFSAALIVGVYERASAEYRPLTAGSPRRLLRVGVLPCQRA